MKITRHLKVPTGDILVVEGAHGPLEMISVGDYGKDRNLKADFLGLSEPLEGVPHGPLMPLEEKWVITISTQYGCSMGCPYCDVPKAGPGRNATFRDLVQQVLTGIRLHPEVKRTKRLNVHFARMGEPSWNPNVLDAARWLKTHLEPADDGQPDFRVHPVVSTIMPRRNEWLRTFVHTWMRVKNRVFGGNAGLQISLNSTDDEQRHYLFNGRALHLHEIATVMAGVLPFGRKIALNVALTADTIVDPLELRRWFPPEEYMVKITPMHETAACKANDIHTPGGYTSYVPYESLERELTEAGYDVIVFVPSVEEDEGLITCGNAILSGSVPRVEFTEVV
jgi:23S rRNA (adenine2503-C2)-methyltransferase